MLSFNKWVKWVTTHSHWKLSVSTCNHSLLCSAQLRRFSLSSLSSTLDTFLQEYSLPVRSPGPAPLLHSERMSCRIPLILLQRLLFYSEMTLQPDGTSWESFLHSREPSSTSLQSQFGCSRLSSSQRRIGLHRNRMLSWIEGPHFLASIWFYSEEPTKSTCSTS